jgi:hypothetical protein
MSPTAPRQKKRSAALPSMDDYLAALNHPHKAGVLALRQAILRVDGRIREAVKWNAPSFFIDDHFATFRLRPAPMFQLILHTGSKASAEPRRMVLDDPGGWLKWPAPDRCVIAIGSDADALARCDAVAGLVKEWVMQL